MVSLCQKRLKKGGRAARLSWEEGGERKYRVPGKGVFREGKGPFVSVQTCTAGEKAPPSPLNIKRGDRKEGLSLTRKGRRI